MDRKCSISLKSTQSMGGQQDTTTECYDGQYLEKGDKKYLSYKRITEDGQCSALISWDDQCLAITQKGSLNSHMEFIPGQTTVNKYGTPMGVLDLDVNTKRFEVETKGNFIEIRLEYEMLAGEGMHTEIIISVKF